MNRRTGSDAREGPRSRLAAALLVMLPGFMFVGLLSPGAVTVDYQAPERAAETLRDFPFPTRQPMIAISAATLDATRELGALRDLLVDGGRLVAHGAKKMLRLPKAQPADGDGDIVLEDQESAGRELVDELFDSTKARDPDELVADLSALWDKRFGKLKGPLDVSDRMWDDFPGEVVVGAGVVPTPVAVPEPESAALVVLGLIGIAVRRTRGA